MTAGMGVWRELPRVSRWVKGTAGVAAVLALGPGLAWAEPAAREATQLVESATFALENVVADPSLTAFRRLMPRAKGVFVAPQLLKAGLVVGASGGRGVLVVRNEKNGEWQGPAFYTFGAPPSACRSERKPRRWWRWP
jgi:SH3 domain-containing YSC84-like protein 1